MATLNEKQLDALALEIKKNPVTAKAGKGKNFCETYAKARPFMEKARALLALVKPTWASALKGLMDSLDEACPIATK